MTSKIDNILGKLSEDDINSVMVMGNEFRRIMSYYTCAMMEIETKFRVLNENMSLEYDRNPIESIKTRLKSVESIKGKIESKGLDVSVEAIEKNLFDIAGVRVICSFPKDVYILEEYLLRQDDIKLIRRKDYIKNPKENGYRSLHLIVAVPIFLAGETKMMNVEIQLRTIAMDFWASLEHKLRYKKDIDYTGDMARRLKECAEESAELDLKMQELHNQVMAL